MTNEKYKPNELPSSITTPSTVSYCINGYRAGELDVHAWDYDGDKDNIVILKTETTIDLRDALKVDIAKLAIQSLTKAIEKEQAESYRKVSELKAVREKFLQLTYQPTEVLPPCEGQLGSNWEEPISGDITDDNYLVK